MVAAWDERFEAVVRANAPFLPPDEPLEPAHSLFDLGLDSMGTVALLLELEEAFEVTFPDEALTPEVFATPGSLWGAICALDPSRRNGDGSAAPGQ
jgi:acyl carrier protein